jgi:hypothetical protein
LLGLSPPYSTLPFPSCVGHGIAAAEVDHAIPDPYSIAAWGGHGAFQAHREHPNPVIGGTVDLYDEERRACRHGPSDINEYGMFMSPAATGEIEILPGSNIS